MQRRGGAGALAPEQQRGGVDDGEEEAIGQRKALADPGVEAARERAVGAELGAEQRPYDSGHGGGVHGAHPIPSSEMSRHNVRTVRSTKP